jgi:two-component system cell cycle sensor histidine kinase/response regulator CckA
MTPMTSPQDRASYRLLLVEDNLIDAGITTRQLAETSGVHLLVDHVLCLAEALEAFKQNAYDGIVADLGLPDSTGTDTVKQLRKLSQEIPIVVLSGDINDSIRERALQEGAQDFVSKNEQAIGLVSDSMLNAEMQSPPARQLPNVILNALKKSSTEMQQRQFKDLVAASPDAIIVTNSQSVVQFVNRAALDLFDKREEDFIGKTSDFPVLRGGVSEIEISRRDGPRKAEMRVVECEWRKSPAYLASIRDVTEQKKHEEELRQRQKMEAVGLLAGGIAHDFNNMLQAMLIYAEMIQMDFPQTDPHWEHSMGIIRAIKRAQMVTGQLLAFSRKQPLQRSVVKLNEVYTGIYGLLRRSLPTSIEISMLTDDKLWPVLADRGQLEQVFMNLAVNAKDAMPEGGRFTLEFKNQIIGTGNNTLPPGEYVQFDVSDSGAGIEPAILRHIFEPFFTTKERGRGTGLGLATCHGIIHQAGGSISASSEPGKGTAFHILLPRTLEKAHDLPRAENENKRNYRGTETILVVEDDAAVLGATSGILKKSGYAVLTAANGDEAKRVIARDTGEIQLVLSDIVMPQLTGPELDEFIVGAHPNLPVLFMTGYSDQPITQQGSDMILRDRRVLMKPFRPQELLQAVRETLDESIHNTHFGQARCTV